MVSNKNTKKVVIIIAWAVLLIIYLIWIHGNYSVLTGNQLELFAGNSTNNLASIDEESKFGGGFAKAQLGSLGTGTYQITVSYRSESVFNGVYAVAEEGVNSDILNGNSPMQLYPQKTTIKFHAWVYQPISDFSLIFNYCGLGKLCINQVAIQRIPSFWFYVIVLALLIYILLQIPCIKGGITDTGYAVIVILIGIAIIASLPNMQKNIIASTDLSFHLFRIEGVRQALFSGQFPVRIQPNWWDYYGYEISLFYPDAFLIIPASLMQLGFSLQGAYKAFVFVLSFSTASTAYWMGKSISGRRLYGLVAAATYTLSMYRITNIYQRGALGEVLAMTFLPVIVLGVYRLYTERKENELSGWIVLSIGISGIIQSHILTCEMVGLFFAVVFIINIRKTLQRKTLLNIFKSFVVTLAINAWFIIPFIQAWSGDYQFKSTGKFNGEIQSKGSFITQIFSMFVNGLVPDQSVSAGIIGEMPQSIGVWSLLIIVLLVSTMIGFRQHLIMDKSLYSLCHQSLIYCCIAVLLSSNSFPYNWLQMRSKIMRSLIGHLQFPWRFLEIASIMVTLAFICALMLLDKIDTKDRAKFNEWRGVIISGILIINVVAVMYCYHVLLDVEGTVHRNYMEYQACKLVGGDQTEYLPIEANVTILDNSIHAEDGVTELPIFYSQLYSVFDCNGNRLITSKSSKGQLQVEGTYENVEELQVKITEPVLWRISEIVSLISIGMLCWGSVRSVKREWKNRMD